MATHTLTLRQDTLPSWLDVSDVTVAQDLPAFAVPASDTVVPEPAAQQFVVVTHEIELSQPVLSSTVRRPQVTPPLPERITTGPAACWTVPAAKQVVLAWAAGRTR